MKQVFLVGVLALTQYLVNAQSDIEGQIHVNNSIRNYILHLPAGYNGQEKLPVVMIFHGGGGNAKQMQRYMHMDPIADKENFITVYPQGINKQWNDGREFDQHIAANNDVLFINQLLDTLVKNYAVNTNRVFSTGISNGGFFSIFLSYKMSQRLLAVAPVCASIPQKIYGEFYPASPVSLLLISGTKDPLVPFNGGNVGNALTGSRGGCTSAGQTVERYVAVNKTSTNAIATDIPDTDKMDDCTAVQYAYEGGKSGSRVVFIKITNGGHTLPGGSQYLPKLIVGKVCRDFNANITIWQFFKSCPNRL
jgi:polyhydroxybutyrate depolymerase